MSNATTIGVDLAKNVFHLHGVDEHGHPVLRRKLARHEVTPFLANRPCCLIGIEAGRASHHWARELTKLGHTVRLMPPQYVKPYVKTNKNDAADAEAICEAVCRPSMRFVPIKSLDQQAILAIHRAREGLVRTRTAQANQIRGLLAEFGFVIQRGIHCVVRAVESIIADADAALPALMKPLLRELVDSAHPGTVDSRRSARRGGADGRGCVAGRVGAARGAGGGCAEAGRLSLRICRRGSDAEDEASACRGPFDTTSETLIACVQLSRLD
ncbi:IS110 family transposase [Methylobacterium sp. P31]